MGWGGVCGGAGAIEAARGWEDLGSWWEAVGLECGPSAGSRARARGSARGERASTRAQGDASARGRKGERRGRPGAGPGPSGARAACTPDPVGRPARCTRRSLVARALPPPPAPPARPGAAFYLRARAWLGLGLGGVCARAPTTSWGARGRLMGKRASSVGVHRLGFRLVVDVGGAECADLVAMGRRASTVGVGGRLGSVWLGLPAEGGGGAVHEQAATAASAGARVAGHAGTEGGGGAPRRPPPARVQRRGGRACRCTRAPCRLALP